MKTHETTRKRLTVPLQSSILLSVMETNSTVGVIVDALLDLLEFEITQASDRQYNLIREAEIATLKHQIVGEYRVRFMDIRDKLKQKISK